MKQMISNWSLRSKIFIVLLLLIALLSSLSFFFINSLGEMSEVSETITSENVPELIWLSHWESQLLVKEQHTAMGTASDFCCDFIERYENFREEGRASMLEVYGSPPGSLSLLEREFELLDFMILNQVSGLLSVDNTEGAASFVSEEYDEALEELRSGITAERENVISTLGDQQSRFDVIIAEALSLLVLVTALIILFALAASYAISAGFSRPVEKMEQQLQQIADGDYGASVEPANQLELVPLTRSINQMSFQLKRSFDMLVLDKQYREQILDSLPIGIVTFDERRQEVSLNKSAREIMGEDFQKEQLPLLQNSNTEMQNFWDLLASKDIFRNTKIAYEQSGEMYTLLCSQSRLVNEKQETIGKIFYFIDITDTESLEQQVRRNEKLALIGELAAGAAHEIRNPLTVIDGFLGLMRQSLSKEDQKKFRLELLQKEIERINMIIEDMLLLAKPGAPNFEWAHVKDVVKEILPLLEETWEMQQVSFHTELEEELLWIDTSQMKQVFHNLIRNSAEAMEGEGNILITGKKKKDVYCIRITDSGPGIPQAERGRLFDPFSTTKKAGTGLGLPIAAQMMNNHSGSIYLRDSSEAGTSFCLEFPLLTEEERPYA